MELVDVCRRSKDAQHVLRRQIIATRKVSVILGNLRVHHSTKVKAWAAVSREHIALFYLPFYSSERNADEYLNGNLKVSVHRQMMARREAQMRRKTTL